MGQEVKERSIPLVLTKDDKFVLSKDLALSVDLSPEQAFILRRMVRLAPKIRDNKELKRIIRKIDATEREAFYNLLKPHLSFKPAPYLLIKP